MEIPPRTPLRGPPIKKPRLETPVPSTPEEAPRDSDDYEPPPSDEEAADDEDEDEGDGDGDGDGDGEYVAGQSQETDEQPAKKKNGGRSSGGARGGSVTRSDRRTRTRLPSICGLHFDHPYSHL